MSRIVVLLLGFWAADWVCAQATDLLTIGGAVLEIGSDGKASLPVPGAEVSLIEFVRADDGSTARSPVATAYTESQGTYQFHPLHTGSYYVEVAKVGYRYSAPQFYGIAVKLDQSHPAQQSTFTLIRPGSLTGRVVDADGQPVPDVKAVVTSARNSMPSVIFGGDVIAVTAADGTFTAADLTPGPHMILISPRGGYQPKVESQFSASDLEKVDQDLETTYWPGGTPTPSAYVPVSPGSSTSVGAIRLREAPYYRVHVSVPHVECKSSEKWFFSAALSGEIAFNVARQIPCTNEFLVSRLRPGTYMFRLSREAVKPREWAIATVSLSDKNSEVSLRLEPEAQITGRIVAFEESSLPPFGKIQIFAKSEGRSTAVRPVTPDAEGKFVLANLAFPRHTIIVQGLSPQYYVKEIHVNGEALRDDTVTLGAELNSAEIVIDDKPGTIVGTVTNRDEPVGSALVRLYPRAPQSVLPLSTVTADSQGKFEIKGLAPGEYRIVARAKATAAQPTGADNDATKVADGGQSISVERGGVSNVTLVLTGPIR